MLTSVLKLVDFEHDAVPRSFRDELHRQVLACSPRAVLFPHQPLMVYSMIMRELSVRTGVNLIAGQRSRVTLSRIFINGVAPGFGKTLGALLLVRMQKEDLLPPGMVFTGPFDCLVTSACSPNFVVNGMHMHAVADQELKTYLPTTIIVAAPASFNRFIADRDEFLCDMPMVCFTDDTPHQPSQGVRYLDSQCVADYIASIEAGDEPVPEVILMSSAKEVMREVPGYLIVRRVIVDEPTKPKVLGYPWRFMGCVEWMLLGTAREELLDAAGSPRVNIANHWGRFLKDQHRKFAKWSGSEEERSSSFNFITVQIDPARMRLLQGLPTCLPQFVTLDYHGPKVLRGIMHPGAHSALCNGDWSSLHIEKRQITDTMLQQLRAMAVDARAFASHSRRAQPDRMRSLADWADESFAVVESELMSGSFSWDHAVVLHRKLDEVCSLMHSYGGGKVLIAVPGSMQHCSDVLRELRNRLGLDILALINPRDRKVDEVLRLFETQAEHHFLLVNLDHFGHGLDIPCVDTIVTTRLLHERDLVQLYGRGVRMGRAWSQEVRLVQIFFDGECPYEPPIIQKRQHPLLISAGGVPTDDLLQDLLQRCGQFSLILSGAAASPVPGEAAGESHEIGRDWSCVCTDSFVNELVADLHDLGSQALDLFDFVPSDGPTVIAKGGITVGAPPRTDFNDSNDEQENQANIQVVRKPGTRVPLQPLPLL